MTTKSFVNLGRTLEEKKLIERRHIVSEVENHIDKIIQDLFQLKQQIETLKETK